MKKGKGGELRDINVKEVSLVDAPANRRKWLFFKSDLEKEGKLKMDYAKLGAFVKALTGKEITEEQLEKLDETSLGQLNVLSQYAVQMPEELSKAVGHFLKLDVEPPAETPLDKPADKPAESEDLPADKLAELTELRDKLDVLITGKKPEPEDATAEILKKIKGIAERIDALEKGEKPATEPEDEPPDKGSGTKEILELLKAIDNRLGVVEKSSGIEKGASEGGGGEPEVDLYSSIDL